MRSNGSIQVNVDKMESPSARCFIHHHPPAEARYQASPGALGYKIIDESGFGGWADEKIEPVREAAPNVLLGRLGQNITEFIHRPFSISQEKSHPQHLTISPMCFRLG